MNSIYETACRGRINIKIAKSKQNQRRRFFFVIKIGRKSFLPFIYLKHVLLPLRRNKEKSGSCVFSLRMTKWIICYISKNASEWKKKQTNQQTNNNNNNVLNFSFILVSASCVVCVHRTKKNVLECVFISLFFMHLFLIFLMHAVIFRLRVFLLSLHLSYRVSFCFFFGCWKINI